MATSPAPISYSSGYSNYSDPRKLAANQRQLVTQKGDILEQQAQDQYLQGTQQAGQTGDYLNGIESPLAQGQGGYNPAELSQIQMTPEQQQDIVNRAGITAGTATAAGADAATRAANATGGNPGAVAAYRARAAQQEGAQAGDAMTNARVAASNAAAGRAESIGNTRIGQQNQGLNYYQGQQQMQNQNAQSAANRQAGIYGTETSGSNQASNLGFQASQTPSTFDKIIGAGVGAASAFLDDGAMAPGRRAVVGEAGPEAVVSDALEDGSAGQFDALSSPDGSGQGSEPGSVQSSTSQMSWDKTPFWKQMQQNARNNLAERQGGGGQPMGGNGGAQQPWNPTSTYSGIGKAVGGLAKLAFAEDGDMGGDMMADGGTIFTKPTEIMMNPNEAAVPLSYRATAKVRPSAAMPAVNQIRNRRMYGNA